MILKFFISYSKQNSAFAKALSICLKEIEQAVFIDCEKIRAGDNYERVIESSIKTCDYFILLWSLVASESVWVNKEIVWACEYNRNIIPFSIKGPSVHPLLKKTHHHEWKSKACAVEELLQIAKSRKEVVSKQKHHKFNGYFGQHGPSIIVSIYNTTNKKAMPTNAILDPAAQFCAIPYEFAHLLSIKTEVGIKRHITTYMGSKVLTTTSFHFILNDSNNIPYVSNKLCTIIMPKSKIENHVVLGANFLKEFELSLNYSKNTVILKKIDRDVKENRKGAAASVLTQRSDRKKRKK